MNGLFRIDYVLFVGLSLGLALLATTGRWASPLHRGRRDYYLLQTLTLLGAVLGAKLSVLLGDSGWPFLASSGEWKSAIWTGRSITGALLLGFLFAESGKILLRYRLPPNDRFAAILPFSFAVGRLGCFGAGCCPGIPWSGRWATPDADGVLRHPIPLYELGFQLAVGLTFLRLAHRQALFGRLFSLYLVLYGAFRFALEPLRATPKIFFGYSGYQFVCLAMIAVGGAVFVVRTVAPPDWWESFRKPAREFEVERSA